MHRLETLSNELLYEIFDYLDGGSLNEAFSNLNRRFDHLMNAVLFRTQLNLFDSIMGEERGFHRVAIPYKHRTLSLSIDGIWDHLGTFPDLVFDSSFCRLQCLRLNDLQPDDVLSVLTDLKHLPHLASLTTSYFYDLGTINEVYRLIFSLTQLKFNKLSIQFCQPIDPLTKATQDQHTHIEHLVIAHSCTEQQLSALLSYTPHLRRLDCRNCIGTKRK